MKTFRVEAKLHIAVFVQAETEEAAISETVDLMEWPGWLLDEEYIATELTETNSVKSGLLQRVYEDSLGWVDRCNCCKTIVNGDERQCPNCGSKMDGERLD